MCQKVNINNISLRNSRDRGDGKKRGGGEREKLRKSQSETERKSKLPWFHLRHLPASLLPRHLHPHPFGIT